MIIITDSTGGIKATRAVQTSGSAVNHNLLDGSVDQDTVAISPTRGDFILANSTPKWSRLAIGAAHTFVKSNGTDAAYGNVDLATADVTGILPKANGGTGNASGIGVFSGCAVDNTTGAQTVSAATLITFDKEEYDTDSYHDTVTNTSRLTVPSTAYYRLTWHLKVQSGTAQVAALSLQINGGSARGVQTLVDIRTINSDFTFTGSAVLSLTAADYAELLFTTLSSTATVGTSTVSVGVVTVRQSAFTIERLGT